MSQSLWNSIVCIMYSISILNRKHFPKHSSIQTLKLKLYLKGNTLHAKKTSPDENNTIKSDEEVTFLSFQSL